MAVPAQLSRLALEPQPGFAVASSLLDSMGLLPATLPPFGSLTASFLLAPEPGVAAGADFTPLPAKLQPSALVVDYSIDSRQQCSLPAAALSGGGASGGDGGLGGRGRDPRPGAGAGGSPTSGAAEAGAAGGVAGAAGTAQTPALAVLELLDASGRQRPSSPLGSPGKRSTSGSPTATASGAALGVDGEGPGGCATRQLCCFRHLLTLEMPASEDDSSGEGCCLAASWRACSCAGPACCAKRCIQGSTTRGEKRARRPALAAPQALWCMCGSWARSLLPWGSPPRCAGAWSAAVPPTSSSRPRAWGLRCWQRWARRLGRRLARRGGLLARASPGRLGGGCLWRVPCAAPHPSVPHLASSAAPQPQNSLSPTERPLAPAGAPVWRRDAGRARRRGGHGGSYVGAAGGRHAAGAHAAPAGRRLPGGASAWPAGLAVGADGAVVQSSTA